MRLLVIAPRTLTIVAGIGVLICTLCLGCTERRTAPPMEHDAAAAQKLREAIDQFPAEGD